MVNVYTHLFELGPYYYYQGKGGVVEITTPIDKCGVLISSGSFHTKFEDFDVNFGIKFFRMMKFISLNIIACVCTSCNSGRAQVKV